MGAITGFTMATPAIVVGMPLGDAPLPLGLDEPFALRGGDRLGPDGIGFDLLHEHQPEFLRWVREACAACLAAERPWFRAAPALLTGPAGAGRTHAARWLARVAGVPFAVLNLSDPVIAANIAASRQMSEALWALPPKIAMAATRCANPVVLVVGAEQASGDAVAGFVSMIDPACGACWREERLATLVDFGEVTWLVQAGQAGRLPHDLRSFVTTVAFELPPRVDSVFALTVMLEVMADRGIRPGVPGFGWEDIRPLLPVNRSPTGKDLYAAVERALVMLDRGVAPQFGAQPQF